MMLMWEKSRRRREHCDEMFVIPFLAKRFMKVLSDLGVWA